MKPLSSLARLLAEHYADLLRTQAANRALVSELEELRVERAELIAENNRLRAQDTWLRKTIKLAATRWGKRREIAAILAKVTE